MCTKLVITITKNVTLTSSVAFFRDLFYNSVVCISDLHNLRRNTKGCYVFMLEAFVQRCSLKKVFLEISQNSRKNTCAKVSFLITLHPRPATFFKKETLAQVFSSKFCEIFKNIFCIEHLWWLFYHFWIWTLTKFFVLKKMNLLRRLNAIVWWYRRWVVMLWNWEKWSPN